MYRGVLIEVVRRTTDTERTLRKLARTPIDLASALRRLAQAQVDATEWKGTKVAEAEEQYQWHVAEATLDAMADGTCDGKNQATRDVQLAACLAKNDTVLGPMGQLKDAESHHRDLLAAVTIAEADVKTLSYQLRAAMAAAELQSALLNAGKKERDD